MLEAAFDYDLPAVDDLARAAPALVGAYQFQWDAERAARASRESLRKISHDLKNLLMAVRLNTEILLRGSPPNERRRGWTQLKRIGGGLARMQGIVEGLLASARSDGPPAPAVPQTVGLDAVDRRFQGFAVAYNPLQYQAHGFAMGSVSK